MLSPGALCLFAVCKFICHKFTRLNFGIELDDWHHQFLDSSSQFFKVEQCMMVLEVRPLQYIRVDWLIQIGYTSFQGLFRLVAPGKRDTRTSYEDEEVTFCDFFLQRSEWRRGERLQSTANEFGQRVRKRTRARLHFISPSLLSTPYSIQVTEVKGNAKQQ